MPSPTLVYWVTRINKKILIGSGMNFSIWSPSWAAHPVSVRCLGYTDFVKPQCPACKQKISNWKHSAIWFDGSATKTCEHCGTAKPVQSFRWQKEAGFGRFSFHISYIHPHEVVPADRIFQALEQATGFSWTYFYANNQDS